MSATVSARALERHAFRYEPLPGGIAPGVTLDEHRRRRARAARRSGLGVLGRLRRDSTRLGGR
jgi:hypothetical protein